MLNLSAMAEHLTENIFLSSDPHFLHHNILVYANRPYDDIDHMTEALVTNHNSVVGEDDLVIWVGDMCMGGVENSLPILNRLNGHKWLILGNHDKPFPVVHGGKPNHKVDHWMQIYGEHFEWIGIHLDCEVVGQPAEIIHFPTKGDSGNKERYLDFRPQQDGQWIIHGHIHSPEVRIAPKHIHVGVDADWTEYGVERYHPIPLSVIETVIQEEK